MSYYDLQRDIIKHFGTKGMKWGVQRATAYAKGEDVGEAGSGGGDDELPEDLVAEGPNGSGYSVSDGSGGFTDVTKLSDITKLDDKQAESLITVVAEDTIDMAKKRLKSASISKAAKFLSGLFG